MDRILAKYQSCLITGPPSTDSSRFSSRAAPQQPLCHLVPLPNGDGLVTNILQFSNGRFKLLDPVQIRLSVFAQDELDTR